MGRKARCFRAAAALAALLALARPGGAVGAEGLRLDGDFVQGGLVYGATDPEARVVLNGRKVRVSPEGRFVIGFGRDAPAEARLEVTHPDGRVVERRLAVERRAYRVQRIEETGQVDLQDPEALLALQVALKARHLLDL